MKTNQVIAKVLEAELEVQESRYRNSVKVVGQVEINDKTYRFVGEHVTGDPVDVELFNGDERFNLSVLQELGFELDLSEVKEKVKSMIEQHEQDKKRKQLAEAKKSYQDDPLQKVAKSLKGWNPSAEVSITSLEQYLDRQGCGISINFKTKIKGGEIEVSISRETTWSGSSYMPRQSGFRYIIRNSNSYDKEDQKWCKREDKIISKVEDLIEQKESTLKWKKKAEKEKRNALQEMQDVFGEDVTEEQRYHSSYGGRGRGYHTTYYKKDSFEITKGDKGYHLNTLGTLSADQVKRIMEIAKEGK